MTPRHHTRVGYDPGMGPRRIDRNAWATVIGGLVTTRARGNKSAFARQVGYTTRTIDRWLAAEVDVSESSVRQVAERMGRNPIELLVTVGYYRPDEVGIVPPPPPVIQEDPVIQLIQADPQWTPEERAGLMKREAELIAADVERRRQNYLWLAKQHRAHKENPA
jgi:hypothetical protein